MDETERPSKSQRKRDMSALQKTGVQLVALNPAQLATLELPERLLEAILDAQRISDFEGRRRQMQFSGKLMRSVDPAPIRARLDQWSGVSREHTVLLHQIEHWRERLLAEDGALALFAAASPRADLQRLRTLVTSVKRDQAAGRTPKNFRELFRVIRAAASHDGAADAHADADG